jgi:hypothetical protein
MRHCVDQSSSHPPRVVMCGDALGINRIQITFVDPDNRSVVVDGLCGETLLDCARRYKMGLRGMWACSTKGQRNIYASPATRLCECVYECWLNASDLCSGRMSVEQPDYDAGLACYECHVQVANEYVQVLNKMNPLSQSEQRQLQKSDDDRGDITFKYE